MSFDVSPIKRLAARATALLRRRSAGAREAGGEAGYGRRSLVGRLVTALIVTALVVYAAGVAGLWWSGGRLIDDSARKQAVQWLGELDELGTPLYASAERDAAMQALAKRLQRFPEVVQVRYYDAAGERLLGEYVPGQKPLAARLSTTERRAAADETYVLTALGEARLRVTAPLRVRRLAPEALFDLRNAESHQSTRIIGYLDFVFDAGAQRVQFARSLIAGSAALAFVLLAAVVFGRHRIRRAMAPLTALEEPLARLARGDVNVDFGGGGDREIAAIRSAFGATLAAIRERDEALRRAESDELTGLPNRRYFMRELALERTRAARGGESSAVLALDIDRFRAVNEDQGADAGNRLLRQVAGLLRSRIRENDVLARFEGDKFLALVRGVNRDGAFKVARSFNQVLQEFQFGAGDERLPITASIGIAMIDGAETALNAAVARAEAACVEAKARGGDCYCAHEGEDPGLAREADSAAWSRYVRAAIEGDGLRFVFQPILGLHRETVGEMYELLLRLAAPEGQLVSPTAFLPVADRLGLLGDVDEWVIRRACEELARVRASGRNATFFANLSGRAFEQGERLATIVGEELARHDLSGRHLVFEITEQAAVQQLQQARATIERLGALGCRFALDDFGTGFSSLGYLKHLPVAFIKISGTFVQSLVTDAVDEVMVRAIVQIARALNMQTVAESVEDERALSRLVELGVDYAQGHAIARPAEDTGDRPRVVEVARTRAARTARFPPRAAAPAPRTTRKR